MHILTRARALAGITALVAALTLLSLSSSILTGFAATDVQSTLSGLTPAFIMRDGAICPPHWC